MQSSISKFVLLSIFTYTYSRSKICIKYSKLGRFSFSPTIDCSCLAYFDLKKYILKPKLSFFSTFILLFSTDATECRNATFLLVFSMKIWKNKASSTLAKLQKFLVLPKMTQSAQTVENSRRVRLFLDRSCAIFSWLNFMVMLCYDWVCYD